MLDRYNWQSPFKFVIIINSGTQKFREEGVKGSTKIKSAAKYLLN
jgi:hypothetical protein